MKQNCMYTKTLYSLTSKLNKKTKYTFNVKKNRRNILDLVSVSAVPTSASIVCRLISLSAFIILRQTNWLKRLERVDVSGKPFTPTACLISKRISNTFYKF
jgi:hypothetical protein